MRPAGGEPSPKDIQAALRKTTEHLASELAQPGSRAPDWSAFEWQIARAAAAVHGVSPLLAQRLRWEGPAGWRQFLDSQRTHTAIRHRRIEDLLRLIETHSRDAGVAIVPLKGAALHAMGLYSAGERPMADVDLLVPPREAERVVRMLAALGFHEFCAIWKHRVFAPEVQQTSDDLGEHAGNYIKVEVHESIGEALPWRVVDVTQVVLPSRLRPGLNGYPSRAALMTHLLLHAAGAMIVRDLRLLHLHDLASLSGRMTDADWDELLNYRASDDSRWWAWPPLRLTAHYFTAAVPGTVLEVLEADAPFLLGRVARRWRLSDVSHSSLWRAVFPGVSWARSPSEALQYAMARVRLGSEVLAHHEPRVAMQSASSQRAGRRLSRGWPAQHRLTFRKMRPGTISAVRTALAQSP